METMRKHVEHIKKHAWFMQETRGFIWFHLDPSNITTKLHDFLISMSPLWTSVCPEARGLLWPKRR